MLPTRAYGAVSFEEEKRLALEQARRLRGETDAATKAGLFEAFQQDLKDSSAELLDDLEVALEQVEHFPTWVLRCASKRLQKDRDLVLRAVHLDPAALRFADEVLRDDREVVLEAVARDGLALRHASPGLRADRDVVLTAVQQGMAVDAAKKKRRPSAQANDFMQRAIWSACSDYNARACFREADESLKKEMPWEKFQLYAKSALASRGETAPVVSASTPRKVDGQQDASFEATMLLSGTTFTCSLPESKLAGKSGLEGLCANDLAETIIQLLPAKTQVKSAKRVFLLLDGIDDPVSPWDFKRPLGDYCMVH